MKEQNHTPITQEVLDWFTSWTKRKVRLHVAPQEAFCHEREIWWCALGANIGFEQDGKGEGYRRPVLIIRRFNKNIFWGIPLTTKAKKGKYYHPVFLADGAPRMVILSQLRLLDSKRLVSKIDTLPKVQFSEIKNALAQILSDEEFSL